MPQLFDTHCHLNFESFEGKVDEVIKSAHSSEVTTILVPGTDLVSSQKAVEIASNHENIFAAVGIHPHHVMEYKITNNELQITNDLKKVEELLQNEKVRAVGEIGMDRHEYQQTKYENPLIDEKYIKLQEQFFREQIKLAIKYKKSLIFHNREAKEDMVPILKEFTHELDFSKTVFHCCEADMELLDFAKKHKMFIGIDGDITWSKRKQRFIKEVPLEMLVLETDSPFLRPEPHEKYPFPNVPANLRAICEKVAEVKEDSFEKIAEVTTQNGRKLFNLENN